MPKKGSRKGLNAVGDKRGLSENAQAALNKGSEPVHGAYSEKAVSLYRKQKNVLAIVEQCGGLPAMLQADIAEGLLRAREIKESIHEHLKEGGDIGQNVGLLQEQRLWHALALNMFEAVHKLVLDKESLDIQQQLT